MYFFNCFWLLIPILLFNLACTRRLPPAYRSWECVPRNIRITENMFRAGVMALPILMRLHIVTHSQQIGLGLYLSGTIVYFASWAAQIFHPNSSWSRSSLGFMAPAYTPILWLSGIGLIGSEQPASHMPLIYWTLSVLFMLLHNLHAGLAHRLNT